MDLGAILLLLGLVVLVGIYVGKPFFRSPGGSNIRMSRKTAQSDHELSSLMAERERVVTALQELDFDQVLGKVPEEEYQYQRADLVQRGITILKRMDQLQHAPATSLAEERLEEAITRRKIEKERASTFHPSSGADEQTVDKTGLTPQVGRPDDSLEDMIAARRRSRAEKAVGFCPHCGHPAQKSDRFCSKCGNSLA